MSQASLGNCYRYSAASIARINWAVRGGLPPEQAITLERQWLIQRGRYHLPTLQYAEAETGGVWLSQKLFAKFLRPGVDIADLSGIPGAVPEG